MLGRGTRTTQKEVAHRSRSTPSCLHSPSHSYPHGRSEYGWACSEYGSGTPSTVGRAPSTVRALRVRLPRDGEPPNPQSGIRHDPRQLTSPIGRAPSAIPLDSAPRRWKAYGPRRGKDAEMIQVEGL